MITVLNPFTIDSDSHSSAHSIEFKDDSLTVQADLQQSDINFIVRQFGLTHELPYGMQVPVFADYSGIPNDFHAAMQYVADSEAAFMQFPAEIRARFNNDPGKLLAFIGDPNNTDEAVSLGLASRPAPPAEPSDSPVPSASAQPPAPVSGEAAGGS